MYDQLLERLGEAHLRQRLSTEAYHTYRAHARGRTVALLADWKRHVLHYGLKATSLYDRGYRNFTDIQVVENQVALRGLPPAFDGFRILQLSDLHIDFEPVLTDVIIERLQGLHYDLCVITGDFRAATTGTYDVMLEQLARLRRHLADPVYAILGNHDFLEFVIPLEEMGYHFLINETVPLQGTGSTIYLSGIDDAFFYETHNLQKARAAIPNGDLAILLSHTPETYRIAASSGYSFMLSGHTHAGQICLPGRIAIQRNAPCPRQMLYGAWRYRTLQGYTSSGTGSTTVPIRFFCPPEITLHTLHASVG